MLEERRQHARWVPSSPMFVSLDASKSGLLLDVGAGGIAVASLIPRNPEEVIALEFELPEGCGRISANAEVAWTRDDGHLSGARFLNLDECLRAQLSRWIEATISRAAVESAVAVPAGVEPLVSGMAEQPSLFQREPIENSSKGPVETHPVDAYFLDRPGAEACSDEIFAIRSGVEAFVRQEPAASAGVDNDEQDNEECASANCEESARLICEEENAETTPEPPKVTREGPTEPAVEICDEPLHAETDEETLAAQASTGTEPTEIVPMADDEDPVFATQSTYVHVERAVQEEHEVRVHLERAAAFHDPARAETEAVEQATDLCVQPWYMPRPAGLQILTEPGLTGSSEKSRHTIELILAVVVLSWALVFLGYQMGSTGVSRESSKETDATIVNEGVAGDSSKGLVPSVEASPAAVGTRMAPTGSGTIKHEAAKPEAKGEAESSSTLGESGTVLQVGAMKLEDNADVLARELQKNNLPAFVFRHRSDRLYRVAVGPFSNEQATERAKTSLEKQGLKPILRHWLPE